MKLITFITIIALSQIPSVFASDAELPNKMLLKCQDGDKITIHYGTDDSDDDVYIDITGEWATKIPLFHFQLDEKHGVMDSIFRRVNGDDVIIRRIVLKQGAYYKEDNKSKKWIPCDHKAL